MARKFCLQDTGLLVGICVDRGGDFADSICNDIVTGDKNGHGKPGGKFENGIVNVNGE